MKYYDINGKELIEPELDEYDLEPRETAHHDAVPEQSHTDVALVTPGGTSIIVKKVDVPARSAWDEVVSYTCIPKPPTTAELADALTEIAEIAADNAVHLDDIDAALVEITGLIVEG